MCKRVIVFLFLAVQCCMAVANLSPSDSIRRLLPRLHGQVKLDALSNLCDIVGNGNDENQNLRYNRIYYAEALRQNNVKAAVYALCNIAYSLSNFDDEKRLVAQLPGILHFIKKHKDYYSYFEIWAILPTLYICEHKLQLAMTEIKKLYAEARKLQSDYGLGVANRLIGFAYLYQGNDVEGIKATAKALALLKKCGDVSYTVQIYPDYCDALLGRKEYRTMAAVTTVWKSQLDSLCAIYKSRGRDTAVFDSRYKYCYLAMAELKMSTGHLSEAAVLLRKAERLAEGTPAMSQTSLLREQTRYYRIRKEYHKALYYCQKWVAASIESDDRSGLITAEEQEALLLTAVGRVAEANVVYRKLYSQKDSIFNTQSRDQLNNLSIINKLDELKSSKAVMSVNYMMAISMGIVLLLALIIYIIHLHRLRAKHLLIYEKMKAEMERREEATEMQNQVSEEELTTDQQVYQRICKLMEDEKPYKNVNLSRDDIAAALSTNSNYIVSAIHHCAGGIRVSEFLNDQRLMYSVKLLNDRPDMSIAEISDVSGFKSRVSFYRFFRSKFGLSPSDYRSKAHAEGAEKRKSMLQ